MAPRNVQCLLSCSLGKSDNEQVVPRSSWRHYFKGVETMEFDHFINTQIVYLIVGFKTTTSSSIMNRGFPEVAGATVLTVLKQWNLIILLAHKLFI